MSSIAGTRRADIAIPVSGVLAATAIGIGVAILDPELAGSTPPHPTLTGSLGDAVWVLQNNARVLAVPFLLVACGFPQRRLSRRAGDLIVPALVTASAIPVGLELGRWGARLVPYLPQLPVEWAALALSAHAWVVARRGHVDHPPARPACGDRARAACRRGGARDLGHPSPTRSPPDQRLHDQRPGRGAHRFPRVVCGSRSWLPAARLSPTTRPGRFKVARSLPLAALGSARPPWSAFRALSTTGSPQGGNQR